MKKIISLLGAMAISVVVAMAAPQAIVVGYGSPVINIIDVESKEVLWQYEMPIKTDRNCNTVKLLEDGEHIVFSTTTSAQVVSIKTKEIVWEYRPESDNVGAEVNSIVPLENGGFSVFVAMEPVLVMDVSADFEVTNERHFTELKGAKRPHTMFRVITMSKDGNYILPWLPSKEIYKLSREGEILYKYQCPIDWVFCPIEQRNGNLLFGTAHRGSMVEYNPETGNIVKEVTTFSKDGKSAYVNYTGQCELISKDRYMVSIWAGHRAQEHDTDNETVLTPALMIINGEGEILWHYTVEEAEEMLKLSAGATGFYYSKKPIIK